MLATGTFDSPFMRTSIMTSRFVDIYQEYVAATGAVFNERVGMLTSVRPNDLQSLFFTIGSVTYEVTFDAQVWPVSIYLSLLYTCILLTIYYVCFDYSCR